MKPSNDKQNQPEPSCENTRENIEEDEEKNKSGKSNSELMAEFFAITSDEDNK